MFRRRVIVLSVVLAFGFIGIIGRLAYLQLVRADELRMMGERRMFRLEQVPPQRAEIRDVRGRIVAHDVPSHDFQLVPAVNAIRNKRQIFVSNIDGLDFDSMLRLTESVGAAAKLEYDLARNALEKSSHLVAILAPYVDDEYGKTLEEKREYVATQVIDSIRRRSGRDGERLLDPRPFMADVGLRAYTAVLQEHAIEQEGFLAAVRPVVGTKRVYPYEELMGHITGYVGNLNSSEYEALRGTWKGDRLIPGKGEIIKQGRVFFSVLPENRGEEIAASGEEAPDIESVEMSIIRPRRVRRAGREFWHAGYFANEMVGRSGVEQYYNQRLRGRHARRVLRLERPNPKGTRQWVSKKTRGEVIHASPLELTIDVDMQQTVRGILLESMDDLDRAHPLPGGKKHQAVCVIMDPETGRIFAMVSIPSYDPNRINKDWDKLNSDPRKPLFNIAMQGSFPPGSVMKPIVSIAALSEGAVTAETEFECAGHISLGRHDYVCMNRAHHGPINIEDALMVSCNIFFYKTGEALHGKRLYRWAWDLGLGHRTGIDIAGETGGNLPVNALTGRGWTTGKTYHFSIGQGPVDASPMQIAVATSAIVNGGKIVRPHVARDSMLDIPVGEITLDPKHVRTVKHGMWKVVQGNYGPGRRGTATRSMSGNNRGFIDGFEYGGKTGSAEHKRGRNAHAWFTCFAPYDKPEIVMVIFVPEGGHGGQTCSPIARRILLKWFPIKREAEEDAVG